jgi:hypothetical protein
VSDAAICVTMPCTPLYARVARTAAAACGVLEGFSVEELGDLRLLVDEVFVAMYELGVRRVELQLSPGDRGVAVHMAADGPLDERRGAADVRFARTLADVVATDVRFDLLGGHPVFAATMTAS